MSPTEAATDPYGGGISIAAVNVGLASDPATTTAPCLASEQPLGHIVSTTIYTSNGVVYDIAIEEVDITVTAQPTQAAKHRRHARHRRRGSHEHGLL